MFDTLQHDYRFTELDPDLLSRPFRAMTNWHVISGSVCSGKTTLIDQLAGRGFQTVPEPGRQYFEREMAKGRTIDEIRADPVALTHCLIDIMLNIEHGLRANDLLFLDRAFPDALAFSRVYGLDPNEILVDCFHHCYASVFLLDRFPVEQDGVRTEDDASADLLDEWLARDYSALGYSVVRVPVLPRQERLEFVLEKVKCT
jgi:predicted ATPase